MYKISTSILSSNNLIDTIEKLNKSITDYIHLDVMDGLFVPNTKFSIEELKDILPQINKPMDIHLMVENPLPYIKAINNPNVEYITIHIEINQDINSLIDTIKSSGYKVCLAIKPNTNIEEIIPYIEKIDMVLIMSVEPGSGGQNFIPNSVERLKAIKKINKNAKAVVQITLTTYDDKLFKILEPNVETSKERAKILEECYKRNI